MQRILQRFSALPRRGRALLVALAVLIAGGAVLIAGFAVKTPPEDRLMKQRIALLEKMIVEFDKVTNKDDMDQAWPVLKDLSARLTELNEQFQALPEETRHKANTSALAQKMQETTARLTAAKAKAFKASLNPG